MARPRQTFIATATVHRDELIDRLVEWPRADLRDLLREIDTRVADLDFTIEHRDWLNAETAKEDVTLALVPRPEKED